MAQIADLLPLGDGDLNRAQRLTMFRKCSGKNKDKINRKKLLLGLAPAFDIDPGLFEKWAFPAFDIAKKYT